MTQAQRCYAGMLVFAFTRDRRYLSMEYSGQRRGEVANLRLPRFKGVIGLKAAGDCGKRHHANTCIIHQSYTMRQPQKSLLSFSVRLGYGMLYLYKSGKIKGLACPSLCSLEM
jgi:hypothetical protein